MKTNKITIIANGYIAGILYALLIAGCTAPASGPAYRETEYQGQVSNETLKVMDKEYPAGYYQESEAAVISENKVRIGVVRFETVPGMEPLSQQATDVFYTTLVKMDLFDVYERDDMEELVAELKLGTTGLVDSETAVRAGNMQGVEYLLTGSISQQGKQQRLDIKVISSSSGKALYADAENGALTTENVIFFARKTAYRLAEKWYGEESTR